MVYKPKVQCDSKLFLVDTIEVGKDEWATVYLCNNRRSVKLYCKDTGLEFKEALRAYYNDGIH